MWTQIKKWIKNTDAEGMVTKVVGIVIALFVAGLLLPTALSGLTTANFSAGVNPAVVTVCTILLPILAVIGIAYIFIKGKG